MVTILREEQGLHNIVPSYGRNLKTMPWMMLYANEGHSILHTNPLPLVVCADFKHHEDLEESRRSPIPMHTAFSNQCFFPVSLRCTCPVCLPTFEHFTLLLALLILVLVGVLLLLCPLCVIFAGRETSSVVSSSSLCCSPPPPL